MTHLVRRVSLLFAAALAVGGLPMATAAQAAPTTPPFTQCPHVGLDTGCAVLIVINPDSSITVLSDPNQPPFDGIEDTLVGVQNNSSQSVPAIQLTSNTDIFGFDGDGLCNASPQPAGCPFGPTGYEGPRTSFAPKTLFTGTVNFTGGLAPGASAYFSLEEAVTTANLQVGPTDVCPPGLTPTIVGTNGPDTIVGTPGNDVIFGLGGDDRIEGGGGNDTICGGDGNDQIDGGAGDDTIYGDAGSDSIGGGAGNDKLFGGPGNDRLSGSDGDDQLNGGAGLDSLSGDGGNDVIVDNDGTGGDRVDGGVGTDTCTGDPTDVIVNCP